MVTRCKIDNYVVISLKMHWRTFGNTSVNVLKIVTNINDSNIRIFHIRIVTCMVTHMVSRGSPW